MSPCTVLKALVFQIPPLRRCFRYVFGVQIPPNRCLEPQGKNTTINKSKPRLVQVSVDPTINDMHAESDALGKNQVSCARYKNWAKVGVSDHISLKLN